MADLATLDQWLADARAVLAEMEPSDPRYARGRAKLQQRQAERVRLRLLATDTCPCGYMLGSHETTGRCTLCINREKERAACWAAR